MSDKLKTENIYCVGRNFIEHVNELANKVPTKPIFFQKSNSTINTSGTIKIPTNQAIEYELEIILLIGKNGSPKSLQAASSFISGFSLGLDLTDRTLQASLKKNGLPWFASKSFKGSAVIDSRFKDKCPESFYLKLNQEVRQKGNVKDMIFSFEEIILHLSKIVKLKKGDIIFTGTPKGVGPISSGDKIEIGFTNLPPKNYLVV